ncbi:hypothetical protein Z517_03388 [Fonsecaea pedrosoi CBS 271.37]|uniref:Unplaced genomic scaffold supercont1.2, whole genome shotgun sequence n=1 Tax=Fonsecaea pedrosoi CBS 271.37 TaxID=1442368 RepID=A0A0D2E255_9EURO|nr:uncharacterized protein Z517_03388 [Fonsecaea pedrosoi CBS 271.37]KIW84141.1 hypothetical protein Z517_03388 [Fonsecaea pedrosoi CBS 271.37]
MPTSIDNKFVPTSLAAAAAAEPEAGSDDDSTIEISRPATVTELVGDARCLSCMRAGSRCHVEQGSASCLQCSVPDGCVFERLIVVKGRVLDFAWSDLIGQTSTIRRRSASTVAPPAKEAVRQPILPTIRDILHQDLQGHVHANDSAVGRMQRPSYSPQDNGLAAGEQNPSKDDAHTNISELSPQNGNSMALGQSQNVHETASLDERLPHAAATVLVAAARDGRTSIGRLSSLIDLECGDCGYRAKSRSDLKKHLARHNRDHKCPIQGCPQKWKGFATRNDLDRHLFVIHRINNRKLKSYKCFGRDCSRPQKEWPRLDNFKQHLKKMHSRESEEVLLQQSNEWYERQLAQQLEHGTLRVSPAAEAAAVQVSAPGRVSCANGNRTDSDSAVEVS